jgi:hypothetical protein
VEVKRRPLYLVRSTYGFEQELPLGQTRDERVPDARRPALAVDSLTVRS